MRCIREFTSLIDPSEDFGKLGSVYRVVPNPTPGYEDRYLTLAELGVGYVNRERFEEVTVSCG